MVGRPLRLPGGLCIRSHVVVPFWIAQTCHISIFDESYIMRLPSREFLAGKARVYIFLSRLATSEAAAHEAVSLLRSALAHRGSARIVVGTGNSQEDLIHALVRAPDLDWSRIEVFHMDEYVGMPAQHPASFRRWLQERLVDVVHPGRTYYLGGDEPNLEQECQRYAALLHAAPIDICFIGFGENGHIAFNDPAVADFNDSLAIKRVKLDERCRRQQVGEGHFPSFDAVPPEALTLTCPELLRAEHLICTVPELRKAEAVRNALKGPITEACPSSVVRTHPAAAVYLDADSASLLPES